MAGRLAAVRRVIVTAHALSRLLNPYRIKAMPVRVEGETVRGYKAEQFADAFLRDLSADATRTQQEKAGDHRRSGGRHRHPCAETPPNIDDRQNPLCPKNRARKPTRHPAP